MKPSFFYLKRHCAACADDELRGSINSADFDLNSASTGGELLSRPAA
jgi:hypothetical protein